MLGGRALLLLDGVKRSYCTTFGEWRFTYALLEDDVDGVRRSYWTFATDDMPLLLLVALGTGGRWLTDGVRRSYCTDG